jgi:type IV pilus assembly protein PilY1
MLSVAFASQVYASSCEDYAATPPFLTNTVKPNVVFMLDNSGSMKEPAYRTGGSSGLSNDCSGSAGTGYDPDTDWYGLFDSEKTYIYDSTIPIDESSFTGTPYTVSVDTSVKGAFVEATCTPSLGVNCWSGNFLNWMTTRKMDSARKVLVGGKAESRAGYDYLEDGSTTWKLVGNNERDDRSFCRSYSYSTSTSPYPDDTKFLIYSPADAGAAKTLYDPYAKIQPTSVSDYIYDENGNAIGEYGTLTDLTHDQQSITFNGTYTKPIVVAKPPSYDGGDPSTIRIEDVTSTGFKLQVQEWGYLDGSHTTESVTYLVIESGTHTLAGTSGDIKLVAGSTIISNNVNSWATVSGLGLSATPVVVASVTTKNNTTAVTTRIRSTSNSGFQIALQRQELTTIDHPAETVHFIAMEPGTTAGSVVMKADTDSGYDHNFKTLSFSGLSATAFIADMQTTDDTDPASLRYENFNSSSVDIKVEEEKSKNNETDHGDESVGYIAIAPVNYNIAVLVDSEPTGLVQDIQDRVRTGISFYRYQRDSDLYTGEYAHGGTLRLSIPKNPFVKADANTGGYYTLDTHVKASTADIVDSIEHYPLVWGTTPLAENLWEVGNYFSQTTPYYSNKPTILDSTSTQEETYVVSEAWDPYVFDIDGSSQKVRCANSFVIIFTDGEPYRDDYIPASVAGYDSDTKNSDCSNTGNTSNSCGDNLDDVAKYLNWDYDSASTVPAPHYRDLRPDTVTGDEDLTGNQHLDIYTVAFGSSNPPQILKDTADNADGEWYGAEDGSALADALNSALTSILSKTSAGSSLSVLSQRATTGSLLNQALFFPSKTYTDSTSSTNYDVTWTGTINSFWFYNSATVSNIRENTTDAANGNYALDIYDDHVLDFLIDSEGNLNIDYYDTAADGSADTTTGALGTYNSIDDVKKIFEIGEILKDRPVDADPTLLVGGDRRYIYGITESGVMNEFVQSNSSNYENLFNLVTSDIPECIGTADTTANVDDTSLTNRQVSAKNLISYIRGASDSFIDQTNISEKCRSRQVDDSGNLWKLGDIIYSTPQVVDYSTTSDGSFSRLYTGANDGMLHSFKIGQLRKNQATTNQSIALCDSDSGSCTHTEIGDEAWTFIPKNAMPYLKYLADPDYNHIYIVDLPAYIIEADDKKILIGGMRFGGATGCTYDSGTKWCGDTDGDGVIDNDSDGYPLQAVPPGASPSSINTANVGLSSYFALDITDPDEPIFLWEFSDPSMGYSYSGPAYITRGTKKYVMLLSGPLSNKGGTNSNQDLSIYMLQLADDFTLTQTFTIDGNADAAFGGRLFTTGIDADVDGKTDAVFFGVTQLDGTDWKGNVFFVAPTDDDPTDASGSVQWEVGKVFATDQKPITAKIEHGSCYNNNYIYFGSGRWFYKLDTPGEEVSTDTNSLWGIQIDNCLDALTDGDATTDCNSTLDRTTNGENDDALCDTTTGLVNSTAEISWEYDGLESNLGGDYFMERNITDPTYTSNISIFTTTEPSSDVCDFGGQTRLWAFNCRTGHSIFDGCSDAKSDPPAGALLLQLSGGNIEDSSLDSDNFDSSSDKSTGWYVGIPPESGTPFVPYSGTLTGEIILWIER